MSRKCEDKAFWLKKLVETHYEQVEFNVAFQAPMTIGSMFPFKDKVDATRVETNTSLRLSEYCTRYGNNGHQIESEGVVTHP